LYSRKYAWLLRQDRLCLIIRSQFSAMLLVYVYTGRTEQKLEAIPMIQNRFFNVAVILVLGLFLAVLLLPGGAFAQDATTGSGPNGQMGPAAGGSVTMYGWHHGQMHANAGQGGAGQMGYPTISSGHISHHATIPSTMTAMHTGMMGSGMGSMMGTDAEHQQHMDAMMAGSDECPLDGEDAADHPTECPYQSGTTTGD
jgi:hypothetical protein